jgi:hypothetical protein
VRQDLGGDRLPFFTRRCFTYRVWINKHLAVQFQGLDVRLTRISGDVVRDILAVVESEIFRALFIHHFHGDPLKFSKLLGGVTAQRLTPNPSLHRGQQRRSEPVGKERMLLGLSHGRH